MKFKLTDYAGKKMGRLTVVKHVGKNNQNRAMWECVCDCGKSKIVSSHYLNGSSFPSCGCYASEITVVRQLKHGMSHSKHQHPTRTYQSWNSARGRCFNPKDKSFGNYGGRGITMSPDWSDFQVFIKDMGECPVGYELDRIDPNGNYEPNNCRWVDDMTQANNRRNNIVIEWGGQKKTATEWSRHFGYSRGYVLTALRNGISFEQLYFRFSMGLRRKKLNSKRQAQKGN